MPRNSSGTMSRVQNWTADAAANIDIEASRFDDENDDFRDEITDSLSRSGKGGMQADLAMGSNKITGLASGSAATDAPNLGQIQDGTGTYALTTGSSNAYVLTPSPAITAYTAGQTFRFKASFTNSDAATINISTVGAQSIKKNAGADDVVSGDIVSGGVYEITYDGTNFQLSSGAGSGSLPRVELAAAQTFALSDANTYQVLTGSTGYTWTIDTNTNVAFSTDTEIKVFNRSTAILTLKAASGVTVNGQDAGSIFLSSYEGGTLRKVATNTWDYIGDSSTDWVNLSYDLETSSNQYLSISNSDWGSYDRAQFAISMWVKRESTGSEQLLCAKRNAGGTDIEFQIRFRSTDKISINTQGASSAGILETTATYTDTSSWHHIFFVYDRANATAGDRMRLWWDGTEVTTFDTDTNPTQDVLTGTDSVTLGYTSSSFDGKMYQWAFVSGSVPDISDFYDSGLVEDVTGVTGLYSLVEINTQGTPNDGILGITPSNNNGVVSSTDVPS